MAKKGELVCCEFCGRDTRNVCRICTRCFSGGDKNKLANYELRDRPSRNMNALGGSCLPEIDDDGEFTEDIDRDEPQK